MRARLPGVRRLLFPAAVAAALAFGAGQALARPADACASPSIGSCGTRGQCLRMCGEWPDAPPDLDLIDGACSSGCCYCEWGFLEG